MKNSYTFNSFGYRSYHEFETDKNPIIIIGNSISFRIGIPYEKTYGYILEQHVNKPVYNFSVGCFLHTNDYQLERSQKIIDMFQPSLVVFQINNLDRVKNQDKTIISKDEKHILDNFYNFYSQLKTTLCNANYLLLYWDTAEYALSQNVIEDLYIYNKYHIDTSLNLDHVFGIKSHKLIAYKLMNVLK